MMNIRLLVSLCLVVLTGCSTTFDGNKVDYKSEGKQGPGLEVPPDLSQISKDVRATVPSGGAANASSLQGSAQQATTKVATGVGANAMGDVQVQREGTQRWLVVGRAPDVLWNEVKTFWVENGFILVIDKPELGILETEWAENRAKIPESGLRRILGKVMDGLYSTNERDKFRTRMERTASGGSEIYISHRGMVEDFVTAQKDQLRWKPRPVDPELEVEFLKRLMVRLGGAPEVAKTALATPPAAVAAALGRARLVKDGSQYGLIVTDALDQAWRRVGLSLDRTNFTVEDRDRSKGVYFVRYVEPDAEKNQPGFFARMFGAKSKESLQKYQIILLGDGQQTRVRVADAQGQIINTVDAQNILKVLADDLK